MIKLDWKKIMKLEYKIKPTDTYENIKQVLKC